MTSKDLSRHTLKGSPLLMVAKVNGMPRPMRKSEKKRIVDRMLPTLSP